LEAEAGGASVTSRVHAVLGAISRVRHGAESPAPAHTPGDPGPQEPEYENGYMYVHYGPGEWTDAKHLMWLHDRLVREHGENPLYDYMWRLRDIIDRLRLDEQVEPGCEI
jgi:hypothetical protein